MGERESEISRLKEAVKSLRKIPKSSEKSSKLDPSTPTKLNVTAGTAASSSVASLGGDDKAVIAQLEQRTKELTEVITLQSYAGQTLGRKVQHLEMNRNKGDINYEYIKNIFLRYLIFKEHGETDTKRLEEILLDLLKVNKEEKETLEKAREPNGLLWGLLYRRDSKQEALTNLSHIVYPTKKMTRVQTEMIMSSSMVVKQSDVNEGEDDQDQDSKILPALSVHKVLNMK